MFLIDDLLFWIPIKSLVYIAETAKELAEKEMDDLTTLQEELFRYEAMKEVGKISAKEYLKKEKEISEKITAILKSNQGR